MAEKIQPRQLEDFSPSDLVKRVELTGELIERREEILVRRISLEDLIVDEDHVAALADSMKGPRRQLSEIVVRARSGGMYEGDVGYDVIDGFHRVEAANFLRWETIQAKVLYGCSDGEMYDLRILAANSVKSVKFARLIFWMKGAWNQTPWCGKITLAQACNLADSHSSGERYKLSSEEAKEVKKWMKEKIDKWMIPLSNLYQILFLARSADPDLVKEVRVKGGSGRGEKGLTPQKLRVIVKAFPEEHELQRKIGSVVSQSAVSTAEVQKIVKEVGQLKDRSKESEVDRVLQDGDGAGSKKEGRREQKTDIRQVTGSLIAFRVNLMKYSDLDENSLKRVFHYLELIRQILEGNK